jgi:GAF domain-containing protein
VSDHVAITAAIAEAARLIGRETSEEETLQAIVRAARQSLPDFDHIGITTIDRHGTPTTRALIGDLVQPMDALQYELREGPCYDTLRGEAVVTAPRLRHDQRWPNFVPRAVQMGLRSQLAVKLFLDQEGTLGGLNLYSTSSDDIDRDAEQVAELFAAHAAVALGVAHERAGLNLALQSRKVIGQALGILMERYQMDEDRAFAFLARASSHGNTKLRDVAQQLVDEVNQPG